MIAEVKNRLANFFSRPARQQARLAKIKASYDASRDTPEYRRHWANADSLSADAANDRDTRHKVSFRARYEVQNNGYLDGMVSTHCNYLIGCGPSLRMETRSREFNERVEMLFHNWMRAISLRSKLWTQAHAKLVDGEGFGLAVFNPNVANRVMLDYVLIEAEQCQSTLNYFMQPGKVDGINFDEFGNPTSYEILEEHPGGTIRNTTFYDTTTVAAEFIMHWFKHRRPGQHRAVSEFVSTLNCGAGNRRFREATIAAAETAADFSVLLKTAANANIESDPVTPFSEMEIEKRMMSALPMGWDAVQMKAEHPTSQYENFVRAQVGETGRPKSIPVNVGQADSSQHNFASGKLDHQSWFAEMRCERVECQEVVLDPLFNLWFPEAGTIYGWQGSPLDMPHSWDWPVLPVADERARASARNMDLQNGSTTLSAVYRENGKDFEEEVVQMADDYGVSVEEMRATLLNRILGTNAAAKVDVEDNETEMPVEVVEDEEEQATTA